MNEQEVLEKLARLPVTAWRYKSAADRSVHVGPVAEDFQAVFGLGQALQAGTAEIAALKEERRALAERLDRLERLVTGPQEAGAAPPSP